MRSISLRVLALALAATAAACVTPHRLEVRQGNVVTAEMLEKLKVGLTKTQVRFVLGTPLIADPFHPQRWDYVYVYKKHARAPAELRRLTLIFEGDALARVEGDLAAAATGFAAPPEGSSAPAQSARATPDPDARARGASP